MFDEYYTCKHCKKVIIKVNKKWLHFDTNTICNLKGTPKKNFWKRSKSVQICKYCNKLIVRTIISSEFSPYVEWLHYDKNQSKYCNLVATPGKHHLKFIKKECKCNG